MSDIKRVMAKVVTHEKTPLVLTVVSCTGVIATAVLTAKAAPKASQILDEMRAERLQDDLPIKDQVRATWKIYIPPICMGIVTLSTIVASNRISERRASILSASAALAANTLREYQQHMLEEIGAERESKVRTKIAKNELKQSPLPEVDHEIFLAGGDGVLVCYDSLSGRYFRSTKDIITGVENELNKQILTSMAISLNDLYYNIGLESIEVGEILGFNVDHMIDIHFSATLDPNNKPVLVISHINMPIPDFNK